MKSLWLTLEEASDVLAQKHLTEAQEKHLSSILDGANHTLRDLGGLLHKYIRVDVQAVNLQDKAKQAWKKIRFEPSDIEKLRGRLTAHVALLSAFNDSLTR